MASINKNRTKLQEARFVLIGKTGSGKSATGNTILQKKAYESRNSAQSVTRKTEYNTNVIDGVFVKVVDTPGFFDNSGILSKRELETEVVRSVAHSAPGPHAFLYVISCDRLTEEEINTAEKILTLFGDDIFEFTILVLVLKNGLDESQTLEQYIDTFPPYFKKFLHRCDNRRLGIDNKHGTEEEKREFVSRLLEVVTNINYAEYYTNEMLQKAQIAIDERKEEIRRKDPSISDQCLEKKIHTELSTGGKLLTVLVSGTVGAAVGGIVGAAAAAGYMVGAGTTVVGLGIGVAAAFACTIS